jgi:hypothetical protein
MDVNIGDNRYRFMIRDIYRKQIDEVMEMQDVCSFPDLITLNGLLSRLEQWKQGKDTVMNFPMANSFINHALDICYRLPYAEIGSDAPGYIKDRIMTYDRDKMNDILEQLQYNVINKKDAGRFISGLTTLKKNYLLPQLKDHLLALVYAVNSKEPRLRLFLNPNLVRLHDFGDNGGRTAWNHCGTPPSIHNFSQYLFTGGLSRLNLSFAVKWRKQILNRTFVYTPPYVEALTANLMDAYPLLPVGREVEKDFATAAKWVDKAKETLQKARQDQNLGAKVKDALAAVTGGFHYRETIRYLDGKRTGYPLFFSELKQLGRVLELGARDGHNGIYYGTFGNLVARPFRIFPQDLAMFFGRGAVSGAMMDEFPVSMGWYFHKKNVPGPLMGYMIYTYFTRTAPLLFSQNHFRDYLAGYFVSDVFNDSQLENLLREFQKEGHLKLK